MIAISTLFHSLIHLNPTGKGKRKVYDKWRGDMMANPRGGCGRARQIVLNLENLAKRDSQGRKWHSSTTIGA